MKRVRRIKRETGTKRQIMGYQERKRRIKIRLEMKNREGGNKGDSERQGQKDSEGRSQKRNRRREGKGEMRERQKNGGRETGTER